MVIQYIILMYFLYVILRPYEIITDKEDYSPFLIFVFIFFFIINYFKSIKDYYNKRKH